MKGGGQWALGAFTVVAALATAASAPSIFHATSPPAGVTGGFGEPSCAVCHIGNDVNAFGGRVEIVGLPAAYEAGREYVLTVDLRADETAVAGFQFSSRFAGGVATRGTAGYLEPVDARTAVTDSAGIHYLHQTEAGSTTADPSGSRWSFSWRAPEAGGPVVMHVAANSGNGDNSPLGDLVYTAERTVPMASDAPTPHPPAPTVQTDRVARSPE